MAFSRFLTSSSLIFTLYQYALSFSTVDADPYFYSRPEIQPPTISVTKHDDGVTDGYIFMAPYDIDQSAPHIFDTDGNLVWSGYGQSATADGHNFQLLQIGNETRLYFFSGTEDNGFGRGHGVILDSSYMEVNSVMTGAGRASGDLHEFNIVGNGTTALMSIYQPSARDLSSYGITGGLGWVIGGVFQEIEIESGEVLFEWDSLDHVGLDAGYYAIDTSTYGTTSTSAWDYFHINAVDKDSLGNYWLSARYMSCLYYINGTDGSIIYEVNGPNSTFDVASNATFDFQHHVRIVSESATGFVLSLFDNASDGSNSTLSSSRGMIIDVNNSTMSVSLVQEYISPEDLLCVSQGSVQVLDNGNVFVGWGKKPYASEFLGNGTAVWDANWENDGGMNYRAFKYNFTSEPVDTPAAFSWSTGDETVVYMSWNGATKVKYWNVYGGDSESNSSFSLVVSTMSKTGFETNTTLNSAYPYVIVEALDSNKRSLSNSSLVGTLDASNLVNSSTTVLESAEAAATTTSTNRARIRSSSYISVFGAAVITIVLASV